jgi:hypothetical protein
VYLNSSWVSSVEGSYDIIPIYVGLQAPCNGDPKNAKMSYDPQTAWNSGVTEAGYAISSANGFNLGYNIVIYNDMEAFPYSGPSSSCSIAVINYLGGWTSRLHQASYHSGVYGSSGSTMAVMVAYLGGTFQVPDDVWPAGGGFWPTSGRYSDQATVWGNTYIPNGDWVWDQRHYQYTSTHSEQYGSPTPYPWSIDSDCSNGEAVGNQSTLYATDRDVGVNEANGSTEDALCNTLG